MVLIFETRRQEGHEVHLRHTPMAGEFAHCIALAHIIRAKPNQLTDDVAQGPCDPDYQTGAQDAERDAKSAPAGHTGNLRIVSGVEGENEPDTLNVNLSESDAILILRLKS
jgi:hypothetical protein